MIIHHDYVMVSGKGGTYHSVFGKKDNQHTMFAWQRENIIVKIARHTRMIKKADVVGNGLLPNIYYA